MLTRLICLMMAATVVHAQMVVTQTTTSPAQQRLVTLDMRNVPLKQALDAIAQQVGARTLYSSGIVNLDTKVTVSVKNVSVEQAIAVTVKGLSLDIRVTPGGETIVVGKKSSGSLLQGIITGTVTDAKTSRPVAGASVSLNAMERGVVTDEKGIYRLNGVSIGQHTVAVRLVGYAKQTRLVTVGEAASITVDFKLEPSASVLDQVIVTGTIVSTELKAVPNAITVITAKQIEERGITRIDQLFRGDIPGLFSLNLGGQSLLDEVTMYSRGATALVGGQNGSAINTSIVGALTNSIKTYIDGIEMADSRYLSQIDPSSIERIEILTGPQASTIYGANAINGVMQIFTKRGRTGKPDLRLGFSTGVAQNNFSNNLAPSHIVDASLSGLEGSFSYNIGGSWNYVGAWTLSKQTQRLGYDGGIRREWPKITADVSARHGLTRNSQHGTQVQNETDLRFTGVWAPTSVGGLGVVQSITQTLSGQTFGLSLRFRPYSWWSHDIGIGSDASTTGSVRNSPLFVSGTDTSGGISGSYAYRASKHYTTTMQLPVSAMTKLNLTLGGDYYRTRSSLWSAAPFSLTGKLAGASVTPDKPGKNAGAFVQGQLGIKDMLFFTYGIRTDWNPTIGDKARVLPGRYGVSFAHDIGLVSAKLRGSYGRSIRPPNTGQKLGVLETASNLTDIFGQYYRNLPNPDLGPEHQQGGEGGIELYFGSRASLVVTRYNQTVDNLILLVGNTSAVEVGGAGPGVDSVPSLGPPAFPANCSSNFIDSNGNCYRYQQEYLNAGSIRNQGWELQGSVNIGPLTTSGTYSWIKSRILGVTPRYNALTLDPNSSGQPFQAGRPFDYIPEHTWALGFHYSQFSSTISLSINGIGMRYISDNDLTLAANTSARLPVYTPRISPLPLTRVYRPLGSGYTTADLNGTRRFSSRIDVTLQVVNLTNYYQNDLSSRYATVGRQTKVGARIHLN